VSVRFCSQYRSGRISCVGNIHRTSRVILRSPGQDGGGSPIEMASSAPDRHCCRRERYDRVRFSFRARRRIPVRSWRSDPPRVISPARSSSFGEERISAGDRRLCAHMRPRARAQNCLLVGPRISRTKGALPDKARRPRQNAVRLSVRAAFAEPAR
jgi:hypothetical protein